VKVIKMLLDFGVLELRLKVSQRSSLWL